MGSQQLLLLVLGFIIVGVAVVAGITMFDVSATASNRDSIISEALYLAQDAQAFYKKPAQFGGGGNTYTSWNVPTGMDSTVSGIYTRTASGSTASIVATGTEIGNDYSTPVKVTISVTPTSVSTTINN